MHTGSYINGTWFHPTSTEVARNINPADTSDVIAEFPLATAADVGRAIEAATAAWPAWKKTPAPSADGYCGAPPRSPAAEPTRSPGR